MNYKWLDDHCLKNKGTIKDFKKEWDAHRFLIADKMYAMMGTLKDENFITLKLEPSYGEALREEYKDKIIPGYYMNKMHWNTIYLDKGVPQELVKSLLTCSYKLILQSLSKKKQQEILEQ